MKTKNGSYPYYSRPAMTGYGYGYTPYPDATGYNFGNVAVDSALPEFVGKPIDDIKEFAKQQQEQYWKNKNTMEAIQTIALTTDVNEKDLDYKQVAIDDATRIIDKINETGDYANALPIVTKAALHLSQNKAFNQAVKAQQEINKRKAEIQARKDITQDVKDAMMKYVDANYQGVQPIEHFPNEFRYDVPYYDAKARPDLVKQYMEYAKYLKPRQTKTGTLLFEADAKDLPQELQDYFAEKITNGKIKLTETEIKNYIKNSVKHNPDAQEWLADMEALGLQDTYNTEKISNDIAETVFGIAVRDDSSDDEELRSIAGRGTKGETSSLLEPLIQVNVSGDSYSFRPKSGLTSSETKAFVEQQEKVLNETANELRTKYGFNTGTLDDKQINDAFIKEYKQHQGEGFTYNGKYIDNSTAKRLFGQIQQAHNDRVLANKKLQPHYKLVRAELEKLVGGMLDRTYPEAKQREQATKLITKAITEGKHIDYINNIIGNSGLPKLSAEILKGVNTAINSLSTTGLELAETSAQVQTITQNAKNTVSDLVTMVSDKTGSKFNTLVGIGDKTDKAWLKAVKSGINNTIGSYQGRIKLPDSSVAILDNSDVETLNNQNSLTVAQLMDKANVVIDFSKVPADKILFDYTPNPEGVIYAVIPAHMKDKNEPNDTGQSITVSIPLVADVSQASGLSVPALKDIYNNKGFRLANQVLNMQLESNGKGLVNLGSVFGAKDDFGRSDYYLDLSKAERPTLMFKRNGAIQYLDINSSEIKDKLFDNWNFDGFLYDDSEY